MATELLLLEDVDNLGRSGDIVSVKPGYARNFLLPQKKAITATIQARRMQQKLQEERAQQAVVDKAEAEAFAAKVQDFVIRTDVKVDQDGNMYGSVTAYDVVRLLTDKGFEIEKRCVHLPHAIKETGTHTIQLRLKEGVASSFKLKVLPEGYKEPEEAPAPAAE